MTTGSTSVLFVHGLWLHATSWDPWVEVFSAAGYPARAPGWPGEADTVEECRRHPEAMAGVGVDDVVRHYATVIAGLEAKPVLVGHSFGGTVVQKLLGQDLAVAAVAIDAAPIKGVNKLSFSSIKGVLPVLGNPANRGRAVALTAAQFRYAFASAVSAEESAALYDRWVVPAPGRPLFQAATAALVRHPETEVDTANAGRGPLLLIGGGSDNIVPESITRATLKRYAHSAAVTDLQVFADRGHSLTIDSGWPEIAETSLAWLQKQGLQG